MENLPVKREDKVSTFIQLAIEQKLEVETIRSLLEMAKIVKEDQAKEDFFLAFTEFQRICPIVARTKEGAKTNAGEVAFWYAPIESIVQQVKESLASCGFSYMFETNVDFKEEIGTVYCTLRHVHGWAETKQVSLPFGKQTNLMTRAQVVEGTLTQAKRQAFCNILGIMTADEERRSHKQKDASTEEITTLRKLILESCIPEGDIIKRCNVEKLEDITQDQALSLIRNLKRVIQKQKEAEGA